MIKKNNCLNINQVMANYIKLIQEAPSHDFIRFLKVEIEFAILYLFVRVFQMRLIYSSENFLSERNFSIRKFSDGQFTAIRKKYRI